MRLNFLKILCILLVVELFNLAVGTPLLGYYEKLSPFDAFYLHLTSFTTLGGPMPITAVGKMYTIIDAFMGYLFIPILTVLLSYKWMRVNLKSLIRDYLKTEKVPEEVQEKLAGIIDKIAENIDDEKKIRKIEELLKDDSSKK